jgi:hypothetical protein
MVMTRAEAIRDGRLASLADDRLALIDRMEDPHQYTLAESTVCTVDGEGCTAEDLLAFWIKKGATRFFARCDHKQSHVSEVVLLVGPRFLDPD